MATETVSRSCLRTLCWCAHRQVIGLAPDQLVSGRTDGSSAPNSYRAGNSGGQVGEGESLATPAHPLV